MVTYIRKSLPKNKVALIAAIIIAIILAINIVPSYSFTSPLDGIASSVDNVVQDFFSDIMTAVIKAIADPFSPQLDTYVTLGAGGDFAYDSIMDYGDSTYKSNLIMNWIVTFAQRFGMIMATILIFTFLLLCMVGRSEQIHDSPLSLLLKYSIAVFLIYSAWDVIIGIVRLSGRIWTEFIMASVEETTSGSSISVVDYAKFKIDTSSMFGFGLKAAGGILWKLFFGVFGIFIIFKLFKSFLKLLLEIAERYFVFTIMLFLFPAIVPAIISNATISIFQAYVRMIISQTFLILTNGLFLKVFTQILIMGGWTHSLTGYIMSFAYLRFCMRIDSYLLTIGMNAAQTGGGMLESMGGAMNTINAALRAGKTMGEARHNLGQTTMNKALATGDKAGYERGVKMSTPMTPFGKYAGKEIPSFEQAMAARGGMPGDRVPQYSQRRAGESFGIAERGNMSAITEAAGRAGMSSNQTNEFVNRMEAAGVSRNDIAGFKQMNGSKEYSGTAGTVQCAYDSNGNVLGYHSTASGGDNYYVSNSQVDEIESYEKSMAADSYLKSGDEDNVKMVLGDNVVADSIIRQSNGDSLGTQTYQYKKEGDEATYEAEVSSASFHLDKLDQKGVSMRSDMNGRDFLVKERLAPAPKDDNKNS